MVIKFTKLLGIIKYINNITCYITILMDSKWKYNSKFICTYKMEYDFDDDDRNILYQLQLLDALELKVNNIVGPDIDETILDNRINELYEKVKNEQEIIDFMKKNPYYKSYSHDPLIIFKMLFSYDDFDKLHKIMCNIYKNSSLE